MVVMEISCSVEKMPGRLVHRWPSKATLPGRGAESMVFAASSIQTKSLGQSRHPRKKQSWGSLCRRVTLRHYNRGDALDPAHRAYRTNARGRFRRAGCVVRGGLRRVAPPGASATSRGRARCSVGHDQLGARELFAVRYCGRASRGRSTRFLRLCLPSDAFGDQRRMVDLTKRSNIQRRPLSSILFSHGTTSGGVMRPTALEGSRRRRPTFELRWTWPRDPENSTVFLGLC
jgi:hypothetical protein